MVILVALVWFALVGTAAADDGPVYVVGDGGSVRPMKDTTIRMAAETVQAICYARFAEYRVDFRFENSEATKTVLLGFPFAAPWGTEDIYTSAAGFRAWQDGVPLAVTLKHGHEGELPVDFYTHTAVFPPGESTVTVSYLVTPDYLDGWSEPGNWNEFDGKLPDAFVGESIGAAQYEYTLHTGSYWAGNIGTAVLRWQLADDFGGFGVPDATRFYSEVDTSDPEYMPTADEILFGRIQADYRIPAPNAYEWVLHNVEPSPGDPFSPYDIGLYFLTTPDDAQDGAPNLHVNPTAHASSSLELGDFAYPASNLVDGKPSTAWAEGVRGTGIGQWVDVTLPTEKTVRELRILPGYAKRPDLFAKYNRPKRLRFDFSDGTSQTVELQDSPTLQRFPVLTTTRRARVTILDVYRGTTRNETYLSEIDFGQAAAPEFEDPGTLLAAAQAVPSADATPGARAPAPAATVVRAGAQSAPTDSLIAEKGSPAQQREPSSPLGLGLLALSLVGVSVGMWRAA
jgi:hypothetical protein